MVLSLFGMQVQERGKSGQQRAAYFLTGRRNVGNYFATASATENIPQKFANSFVRVKWCGKSAPLCEQSERQCKP